MIDFEDFPEKAQPGYQALLAELSADLHAKGMKLYVSVPYTTKTRTMQRYLPLADGVVMMNYDRTLSGGTPGPVASQEWFTGNWFCAIR